MALMGNDPYEGAFYKDLTKGSILWHPRFGKCTFYKYDSMRKRLEVFDRYKMVRYIPEGELSKCQLPKSKES